MSRAGITHGGDEKCIHILFGDSEGNSHLEDLNVDGRMVVKETECKGEEWTELAQDRVQEQVFLNILMTFGSHKMQGISRQAQKFAHIISFAT
jgi:hypothetical protein